VISARYNKAFVGAAVAFLTSLQASLDGPVTAKEWVTAGIAAVVAWGAVWGVPNEPKT
jgi:hypothetical protein